MSTDLPVGSLCLPLEEVIFVAGGQLIDGVGQQKSPAEITRMSTDSRTLQPGDCFVALIGESFDAHNFVEQVASAGAGLIVVQRPVQGLAVSQLVVPDTLVALGQIAVAWRQRFKVPVACLAGSSGKTTTKEMTADILEQSTNALVTRGNLNNLIGLPHMLFSLTPEHQVAVLEIGMNVPDENRRLVQMADPDCVLLTNITHAHIGMFTSHDAHFEAEAEPIRYAPERALLIFNADDTKSGKAREKYAGGRRVWTYGVKQPADLRASEIVPLEPYGYRFRLDGMGFSGEQVELRVFGRHNVSNAVAAAALGRYFEVPPASIAEALSAFRPRLNRSEVEQMHGWYLVKDYYNAIPAAVQLALASLGDFKVPGRKFALLGDMRELGEFEEAFHREVGESVATAGLHRLYTIGDLGRIINETARSRGVDTVHLPDVAAAAPELLGALLPGDLLLVKGSRALKLEHLYELLKGENPTGKVTH